MKRVQQALEGIGIPVFAGIWRATSSSPNAPDQYLVYSDILLFIFTIEQKILH